jgi:hypothetical protein
LIWHTHYTSGLIPHAAAEKGSFWFRDVMKFVDHFRGVASASIGLGDTVLLWEDVWNGHFLANELPRLYSYARNKKISVVQFMAHQDIHSQFHTPILVQASLELQLQSILDQVQLNQRMKDEWSYIWGNRIYTSNRFYNLNFRYM